MVDANYAEWARGKDVQQCPECRVRIEKASGCNHMTCGSCHYQFCWLCRGRYYDGHFAPFNPFGCPGQQYAFTEEDSCYRPGPWLMPFLRLLMVAVGLPLLLAAGGIGLSLYLAVLGLLFTLACACTPFQLLTRLCFECGVDACEGLYDSLINLWRATWGWMCFNCSDDD